MKAITAKNFDQAHPPMRRDDRDAAHRKARKAFETMSVYYHSDDMQTKLQRRVHLVFYVLFWFLPWVVRFGAFLFLD